MSYNGHKNEATALVYTWEVIPLLANEANEQSHLTEWTGVTPKWVKETFGELILKDNLPEDGLLQDFVTASVFSIDWKAIAEDVQKYWDENYV